MEVVQLLLTGPRVGGVPDHARQVNKECLKPFVLTMLRALLVCFRDESWPVRVDDCYEPLTAVVVEHKSLLCGAVWISCWNRSVMPPAWQPRGSSRGSPRSLGHFWTICTRCGASVWL